MVHTTITEGLITTETPTATADSETRIMVIKTIRVTKITAGSGIPMVTADSEIKTAVIRTTRETRITAGSEILMVTVADQSLPAVDSGIVQAAKAPVQADSRAAGAALDKTIINKETNS